MKQYRNAKVQATGFSLGSFNFDADNQPLSLRELHRALENINNGQGILLYNMLEEVGSKHSNFH